MKGLHHLRRIQDAVQPLKPTIRYGIVAECANWLNKLHPIILFPKTNFEWLWTAQKLTKLQSHQKLNMLQGLENGKKRFDPIRTSHCPAYAFNASLPTSKLPMAWKIAHVNPPHKENLTITPISKRPILLTSIPCKLMEHIIINNLREKLNSVLRRQQWELRKGLYCGPSTVLRIVI